MSEPSVYLAFEGNGELMNCLLHENRYRQLVRETLIRSPWWMRSTLRHIPILGWFKRMALEWRVERATERHLDEVRLMKEEAELDGGQLLELTTEQYKTFIAEMETRANAG